LGVLAEYWVAMILWCQFYRVVAMRYKTKVGEVDIIATRGKSVRFVEVKYRPSFDIGMNAITPKAQARILRTAEHYMLVHKKESHNLNYEWHCDVILVNKFFGIKHIKNAF
jgi:putative endonuclease